MSLHLQPYFGDKPLSQFSDWDLDHYKKHRSEAGAKSSTINRGLATISHLFNQAVEWKWLDHKPIRIRRLKEEPSRITYLTEAQVARLLETLHSHRLGDWYAQDGNFKHPVGAHRPGASGHLHP